MLQHPEDKPMHVIRETAYRWVYTVDCEGCGCAGLRLINGMCPNGKRV